MSEPAWRVTGANDDGSLGEGVTFAVGIKPDHTGWITAEMEYATDAASLFLSHQQLRELRDALNTLLGRQSDRGEP